MRLFLLFIVCFGVGFQTLFAVAAPESKPPTICLNMIVKDEAQVIKRCLGSVKPMIDYWVIVDTGSSDGTQDIIREFMKDIPGELHERPWKNFGHNRNEALQLAKGKGDYVLFIDADEMFEYSPDFKKPILDKDYYYIDTRFCGMNYGRVLIVKNILMWKWHGVLHEWLDSPLARTVDTLPNVTNIVRTDGARSKDPKKFLKDAAVLEAGLKDEPNNSRYMFYLAQSYRDAGENKKAIEKYEKRIAMGGFDQELFWSKLQIGILQEAENMPEDVIVHTYLTAFKMRPVRAEPLFRLCNYYRRKGDYASGLNIAREALSIPHSHDVLFVESWIYDWGILLEYSICAYWVDEFVEAKISSDLLLSNPALPDYVRDCVLKNLSWINLKLAETRPLDLLDPEKSLELQPGANVTFSK